MADSTANKNPIRIPNELMRELKLAQVAEWQRTSTSPSYGELLLAAWTKAKGLAPAAPHATNPSTPSPHQPWIDKLLNILTHGTPAQIHGIQSNLDAFCAQLELESLRQGQPRRRAAGGD